MGLMKKLHPHPHHPPAAIPLLIHPHPFTYTKIAWVRAAPPVNFLSVHRYADSGGIILLLTISYANGRWMLSAVAYCTKGCWFAQEMSWCLCGKHWYGQHWHMGQEGPGHKSATQESPLLLLLFLQFSPSASPPMHIVTMWTITTSFSVLLCWQWLMQQFATCPWSRSYFLSFCICYQRGE